MTTRKLTNPTMTAPRLTGEQKATKSAPPATEAKKKTTLSTIYKDSFVTIKSDDPKMTQAQGKALAATIEDAYKFDTKTEAWQNQAPLNKGSLVVEALTKAGYDKVLGGDSTGVAGVTMGPNLMAVPENLASSTNPDDHDTIAHELNHVQDFREAGKNIDKIPVYEQEGKAYLMGDSYPIALGEDKKDPVLGDIGNFLTKLTSAQARDVMDNYRDGSAEGDSSRNGFRDETTGALYVEFLKLHYNGGSSDAIQKLAQVTSEVGSGKTYDAAFKDQFGTSSKASEDAFVKWVGDTEKDPSARMKGTLWEPYMKSSTPAK
jgi:hypothetical protein